MMRILDNWNNRLTEHERGTVKLWVFAGVVFVMGILVMLVGS